MTPLPEKMITHCIQCHELFTATNTHTEAGWRETQLSGLCEDCFNEVCADAEDGMEDDDEPTR